MNPALVTDLPWLPMDTAPRDHTPIDVKMPDGSVKRAMWAWGGGWAGEFDRSRPRGFGGWLMFNDSHQPVAWRAVAANEVRDVQRRPRLADALKDIQGNYDTPGWKPDGGWR